ncbi:MAG TPA: FAD-dependent oxidoreductase [Acidimicrobiales bacterium]|nr:FAD-dependent oxidoreductase [Acidimicrobiales bacterium]
MQAGRDHAALGPSAQDCDVVVVGAGPYGLSAAAHLRALGLEPRVLGVPMSAWVEHMPRGMFLKSAPAASSLDAPCRGFALEDFCAGRGLEPLTELTPVALELFVDYGCWFQEHLVPDVERVEVRQVAPARGGFVLELGTGELVRTRAVVLACGFSPFRHVPGELDGADLGGQLSHSSEHSDLGVLAGQRVAVVGAGQSALESAVLLIEAGATVHLVARAPRISWGSPPSEARSVLERIRKPASPLGPGWSLVAAAKGAPLFRHLPAALRVELVRRVLGPSGGWWLRRRFSERISLHLSARVRAATRGDGTVRLVLERPGGEEVLEVDHVLAATGYAVELDRLGFLVPELRRGLRRVGGSPRLSRSLESSREGLFFTGLAAAATFGPVLRFVCGTRVASPALARGVLERLHGRSLASARTHLRGSRPASEPASGERAAHEPERSATQGSHALDQREG